MKTMLPFIFIFFLLADTANSTSFMTSDSYWKGKTAYMEGDYKTAFNTWIKHAEAGVSEAQGLIANLYHAGHGVTKNYEQAHKWYLKSAKKGFSPAQLGLGNMLADGLGIKKNYVTAHMWFNLAAASGNHRAQYNLKKIESRMNQKDIKLAEKLADDWLKAHPQKL